MRYWTTAHIRIISLDAKSLFGLLLEGSGAQIDLVWIADGEKPFVTFFRGNHGFWSRNWNVQKGMVFCRVCGQIEKLWFVIAVVNIFVLFPADHEHAIRHAVAVVFTECKIPVFSSGAGFDQ